ncbi:MAG: TetR/AcrR family transcriptional regulator [Propionibacteriaceae bacterium]|jgi:AcrR family transcriptional regulator|nr:TetR/AcrR family transcriptional regulator [Propionibacteriaceae bacterium]
MGFAELDGPSQDRIVNAACAVFAQHGYRKASMRDIAEAAAVSKAVLFKYFSTKDNLYAFVFGRAAEAIAAADAAARAEAGSRAGLFDLMRLSAQHRLALFQDHPWFYRFAYTAAFDPDPFAQSLARQAYGQGGAASDAEAPAAYPGVRDDLTPAEARRLIRWVSEGYLEERLRDGDLDQGRLMSGFERWIDILESLLATADDPGSDPMTAPGPGGPAGDSAAEAT